MGYSYDKTPAAPGGNGTLSVLPGETRELLSTMAAISQPRKNPDADGASYVVVPDGWVVQSLPMLGDPPRPTGIVRLRDAPSFILWFNDHKVDASRIYASLDPAQFLAVVDDFNATDSNDEPADQAAWRSYRAEFKVPPSREWNLWNAANRKHMGQLAFAEFLQDNLPDVVQPSGAELLETALRFEAAQSGHFVAAQRLQDGSHDLQWKADNNASGTVRLPEQIVLSIPVFENDVPLELHARLRYRVKEGALAIWFELVRPHKVLEAAFRATWQRIEAETATPVLLGSPE